MTVSKELTDKVLQRLTDNGTVSRLKAELRSNIFSLLKDTNAAQVAPSGRLAGKQKTQLDTQQGKLALYLVKDFLTELGFEYTANVLEAESSQHKALSRTESMGKLSLDPSSTDPAPVLIQALVRGVAAFPSLEDNAKSIQPDIQESIQPGVQESIQSDAKESTQPGVKDSIQPNVQEPIQPGVQDAKVKLEDYDDDFSVDDSPAVTRESKQDSIDDDKAAGKRADLPAAIQLLPKNESQSEANSLELLPTPIVEDMRRRGNYISSEDDCIPAPSKDSSHSSLRNDFLVEDTLSQEEPPDNLESLDTSERTVSPDSGIHNDLDYFEEIE
ncbi:MAG: hypothetical protein SGCHY_004030 [Lobulomycetales sp.]